MQKKLYVNSALGRTSPFRSVRPTSGHGNQDQPASTGVGAADEPSDWLGLFAHVPDHLVDHRLDWSFEMICYAHREKLFRTYRKAGILFSAVTISSIASVGEGPRSWVNRRYGLKLHAAVRIRRKDREKFHLVLQAQCHQIHQESEAHPDLAGLRPFRPLLKHMRHPAEGSSIAFKHYTQDWGSLLHLSRRYDKNVQDYLQHAMDRNLDLTRAGTSTIHSTADFRRIARKLQQRQLRILWELEHAPTERTSLFRLGAENSLRPAGVLNNKSNGTAKPPREPVERDEAKDGSYGLLRQMTSYGLQLGGKYYPTVQRLRAIIWPY
jgi:hypothetical protein